MQLKEKASLAFISESVSEKITFGQAVITALGNAAADFPNLPVPLLDLSAINADLASAAVAARTGDHVAVANLTNIEKNWEDDFRKTAIYVTAVANGDAATIRKAGLEPTKGESQPTQKPGIISKFAVQVDPGKGCFSAGCEPAEGANAYVYAAATNDVQITYSGDTMIITAGTNTIYIRVDTHRKTHFTNMPANVPLNVSMYAVNRAGSGPATESNSVIPQ